MSCEHQDGMPLGIDFSKILVRLLEASWDGKFTKDRSKTISKKRLKKKSSKIDKRSPQVFDMVLKRKKERDGERKTNPATELENKIALKVPCVA